LLSVVLLIDSSLFTVSALHSRPARQWGGYVLIALAVLTKGPLAIALCGLTFLFAIAASSDIRRRFLALHWAVALVLIVAIAAPWFLYMWRRFGEEFVEGYLLNENVRLFSRRLYAGQPGAGFYFRILAAGLLPWTGLLVGRLWDDTRRAIRGVRVDAVAVLLV